MIEDYKIIDKVLDIPFENSRNEKFLMGAYKTSHNDREVEHAIIYKGAIKASKKIINLRINSACYTSDIFDCQRCDCSWQLNEAMRYIQENEGLIIYHFHHEGRAFGFTNKLKSFDIMKKKGKTSWEACVDLHNKDDHRSYLSTIKILQDLNITRINLLTNNPDKKAILEKFDIQVNDVISLVSKNPKLQPYLAIKRDKLGHFIPGNE